MMINNKVDKTKIHSTFKPYTYYLNISELNESQIETIVDTPYEIETSRYTVDVPTAFIRGEIMINNELFDYEVTIGSCELNQQDDIYYCNSDHCYKFIHNKEEITEDYVYDYIQRLWEIVEVENLPIYIEEKN